MGLVACRASDADETLDFVRVVPRTVSTPDAQRLFDQSIARGYVPTSTPIEVGFGDSEEVAAVKVYGAAPFILEIRGRGDVDLGFDRIDLTDLGVGWHMFQVSTRVATNSAILRFEQVGEVAGTIPEIELWAAKESATRSKLDLSQDALPDGFVVAKASTNSDEISGGNCAEFSATLAVPPSQLAHTYLAYSHAGAFRPFVMKRSINGGVATGGAWLDGDDGHPATVEQIDPRVMVAGSNSITLCVPDEATQTVTVSNLRIVGELSRGTNLGRTAVVGSEERDAGALVDRDPGTSLVVAEGDPVRVAFERLIAPDALVFSGAAVPGVKSLECVDRKGQVSTLATHRLDGATRTAFGIAGGSAACAALSIRFEASATIDEIEVVGSGAAEPVDWPEVVVTSAREHYGELASIEGFVARPENMPGAVRVEVSGQPTDSLDGRFALAISRSTDVTAAWPVDIAAHLPDGTTQHQHIVLAQNAIPRPTAAPAVGSGVPSIALTGTDAMFGRLGQAGRNVGLVDKSGQPVAREQSALDDLNGPGKLPTDFVGYGIR